MSIQIIRIPYLYFRLVFWTGIMIFTKFIFIFAIIEEARAVPGVSILSLIDMVSISLYNELALPAFYSLDFYAH